MLCIVGIRWVREEGKDFDNNKSENVLVVIVSSITLKTIVRRGTFSCAAVYGASGAQSRNMSTTQQAVHARTPASLCCRRLWCANSFATGSRDSLSASSCSSPRNSSQSAFNRVSRSPTPICLPGRPTRGCLNFSFLSESCSSSSSTASVAALRRLRVAISRGCACACDGGSPGTVLLRIS